MSQEISKVQSPEPPRDPNNISLCMKDFYNFKEQNGNKILEFLNSLIRTSEIRGFNSEELIVYKTQLDRVNKLISEKRDNLAFDLFFRTFPTCLPYRSRFKL
jgi:hypothetical protein